MAQKLISFNPSSEAVRIYQASRSTIVGSCLHFFARQANKHVKKEGCETSGKYLRNWPETWFMFYIGAQDDPGIGNPRPIFNTSLQIIQIDM